MVPSAASKAASSAAPRAAFPHAVAAGVAATAVGVLLVVLAAGMAAIEVLIGTVVDGGLVTIYALAAGGWGWLATKRFTRGAAPSLRGVTAAAAGLGGVGLLAHGLGLAGALNLYTLVAVVVGGIAALALELRRVRRDALAPHAPLAWWAVAFAVPLTIALLAAAVFPGALWNPLDPHPYDVTSYHLQVPREWFDAGRIVPLTHNAFGYFPMLIETHFLAMMHARRGPWDAMYACQLISLLHAGLAAAATYAAARTLDVPRPRALCAAWMTAATPWVLMLAGVAYVEPGVLLYTTLAAAWAIRAVRGGGAMAGAMAGLACGCKYTAVVMTAAPVVLAIAVVGLFVRSRAKPQAALTAKRRGDFDDAGETHPPPPEGGGRGRGADASPQQSTFPVPPPPGEVRWGRAAATSQGSADPPSHSSTKNVRLMTHAVRQANTSALESKASDRPHLTSPGGGGTGLAHDRSVTSVSPWRQALLAALFAALLAAPWLVRNLVWTGNPVFPLAASLLGSAHFKPDQVERYVVAHRPPAGRDSIAARLAAGGRAAFLDRQYGYVLLPAACVAAALGLRRRGTMALVIVALAMTGVWVFATHVVGRFQTPVIPLAAVLVAAAPWHRFVVYALAAVHGSIGIGVVVHLATTPYLAGPDGIDRSRLDLAAAGLFRLGRADLSVFQPPALQQARLSGERVALIGDAGAFLYDLPPGRLMYRSVFDVHVPPGVGLVDGWLGTPVADLRRAGWWVVIHPAELRRLSATYRNLPPLAPPYAGAGSQPIVLPPQR